jgi:predicted DNA-binding ribbon-helix-helix protein
VDLCPHLYFDTNDCLLSIYRLYQSTSEDTDPHLVFSLYILCIKVQVRTQIHILSMWICVLTCTLIQTIYREKTRRRSVSSLVLWCKRYIKRRQDVDTDPHLVFSLYIVCIKVQVRTQIHVLSSLYISFVSKYKWGQRSTSCQYIERRLKTWICVLICTLIQTIYREKTRRGSLSSLVLWYKRYIERRQDVDLCRLHQVTSEDTDPCLVFSLYIVCIKVQMRTQIHVLSSLYISFVSKYKWGHRYTSCLLNDI